MILDLDELKEFILLLSWFLLTWWVSTIDLQRLVSKAAVLFVILTCTRWSCLLSLDSHLTVNQFLTNQYSRFLTSSCNTTLRLYYGILCMYQIA